MRLLVALGLAWVSLAPGASHAGAAQLPNFYAYNPTDIQIGVPDGAEPNGYALRFTTSAGNTGVYPFELLTNPQDLANLAAPGGTALQCVAWVSRICTARQPVGQFVWDDNHQHFHLDDFAQYELRSVLADDSPDFSAQGLVARNPKASYCMEDVQAGATFTASANDAPLYRFCAGYIQGISPGWDDVYGPGLFGQQIPLNGVPDGRYDLVVILNPDGRYLETTRADDLAYTTVIISAGGSKVQVM